jgi:Tfp pilus assembly protein PilN
VSRSDLNLSTHPFPAYRLLNLVLGLGFVVLLVITVWQVVGFIRFNSMVRDIRDDEASARVEAESLGRHVESLESILDRPEATEKLSEIGFLNGLIARKELSWTQLFGNLEDMVPDSVRLASLRPDVSENGAITLHLDIVGRSITDVSGFIQTLEASPEFENVVVSVEQKAEAATTDVNVTLTANYFPKRALQ